MGGLESTQRLLACGLLSLWLAACASDGTTATSSVEEISTVASEPQAEGEASRQEVEDAAAAQVVAETMSTDSPEEVPEDPTEIFIGPEPVLVEQPSKSFEARSMEAQQSAGQATSLVEAARLERARRRTDATSRIVINNENLDQFATGQLTVAGSRAEEGATDPGDAFESDSAADGEEYWRSEARRIRQGWRDATDRVTEFEEETFRLRQRFYAEDDGFYRDSQIKPAWDRAIDQLEAARREVVTRQQELEDFLERGRQSGALPGWLREGVELEPLPETKPEEIHEPDEPPIYVEDDGAVER